MRTGCESAGFPGDVNCSGGCITNDQISRPVHASGMPLRLLLEQGSTYMGYTYVQL